MSSIKKKKRLKRPVKFFGGLPGEGITENLENLKVFISYKFCCWDIGHGFRNWIVEEKRLNSDQAFLCLMVSLDTMQCLESDLGGGKGL